MDFAHTLPAVNASLNALSGILLVIGYVLIRRKQVALHKRFMLAACASSSLFLCLYVLNHILRHGLVTRFPGVGPIRVVYFSILISHTTLAITIVPLAIVTVIRGLKMRVEKHRRIARWTFPLWAYVSATGVLVYFFIYQWYPSA